MKQRYRTLADYFKQQNHTSQIALARRLGISKSYMSMLVSGDRQPALDLAIEIEKATGVPVASLVTEAQAS